MDAPVIRTARAADAEDFLALVCQLADYEKLEPPDAPAQARLLEDAFGPSPRFEVQLAFRGGDAVGYALYFESYSSFLALPTLYLEDLFVVPAARKGGIGLALFRAVAAEALHRGCGRMEWAVLTWNQLAIDFYDRLEAEALTGWRTYRLSGPALARVARGAATGHDP